MEFETFNYRQILKEELVERGKKNPSYSLRAFSKSVGLTPAMVSAVLRGTRNLSSDAAHEVAIKLGYDPKAARTFSLLVSLDSAKDPSKRERLLEEIREYSPTLVTRDLTVDLFKTIADLSHVATLVLLELPKPQTKTKDFIATRLGLAVPEVELILGRLKRLDLVEETPEGFRKLFTETLQIHTETRSAALQKFYKQALETAVLALGKQDLQERYFRSHTMVFDPKDLPKIAQAIEEFFLKVGALTSQATHPTEVYHLGTQFFRLTKIQGEAP
jgi:uncharacterized protein (TIGR02147 family)